PHPVQYLAQGGDTYVHAGQVRSGPAGSPAAAGTAPGLRVVVVEPSRAEKSTRGFRFGLTRTTPSAGSPTVWTSRPSGGGRWPGPRPAGSAAAGPQSAPAR